MFVIYNRLSISLTTDYHSQMNASNKKKSMFVKKLVKNLQNIYIKDLYFCKPHSIILGIWEARIIIPHVII